MDIMHSIARLKAEAGHRDVELSDRALLVGVAALIVSAGDENPVEAVETATQVLEAIDEMLPIYRETRRQSDDARKVTAKVEPATIRGMLEDLHTAVLTATEAYPDGHPNEGAYIVGFEEYERLDGLVGKVERLMDALELGLSQHEKAEGGAR